MNGLQKYKLLPGTRILKKRTDILLRHHRMPGDILTMTPLIRDIKKTYGDMVRLQVESPQGREVWQNNSYLSLADDFTPSLSYDLDNKMAAENDARGLNLAEGFRQDFIKQSGLHIIPSTMWPDIFLTQKEIDDFIDKFSFNKNLKFKYWVVSPGNKSSCQVKIWPRFKWMEFFEQNKHCIFAQIGQSKYGHKPFELYNVHNYIDKTTLRELFILIYLSQGTIGYISLHMHIAAAFKLQSLIIAGGRELSSLFKYPNHWAAASIGSLPCCLCGGCYKGKKKTVKECCGEYYIRWEDGDIPACMGFSIEEIVNAFNWMEMLSDRINTNRKDCIVEEKKIKVVKKEPEFFMLSGVKDESKQKNINSKGIFRILCNTRHYGGGERTAINIMKLMLDEGYEVQIVSLDCEVAEQAIQNWPEYDSPAMGSEFAAARPKEAYAVHPENETECDIAFFHVNDSLIKLCRMDADGVCHRNPEGKTESHSIVDKHFKLAKRKIVSVNYNIYGLEHYIDSDCFIFQSEKLKHEFFTSLNICQLDTQGNCAKEYLPYKDKVFVLRPPTYLKPFLNKQYERDWSKLCLIRHSSQGDRKYFDNINDQVRRIYEIRDDVEIHLMPAPSCLYDMRVHTYSYNAINPVHYLGLGNVFWYFVPEEKFVEIGANVVLEAMASGLPVLCNMNGGLTDIVDGDVGWLCRNEEGMYSAIRGMTEEAIRKKGLAAKKKVREIVRPDLWIKCITGKK